MVPGHVIPANKGVTFMNKRIKQIDIKLAVYVTIVILSLLNLALMLVNINIKQTYTGILTKTWSVTTTIVSQSDGTYNTRISYYGNYYVKDENKNFIYYSSDGNLPECYTLESTTRTSIYGYLDDKHPEYVVIIIIFYMVFIMYSLVVYIIRGDVNS